jgi:hypothetical protein
VIIKIRRVECTMCINPLRRSRFVIWYACYISQGDTVQSLLKGGHVIEYMEILYFAHFMVNTVDHHSCYFMLQFSASRHHMCSALVVWKSNQISFLCA